MNILIVEDEKPIAKYIEKCCRNILHSEVKSISLCHTLEQASSLLFSRQIDVCLLDLNLNGENGYALLKMAVSGTFHTIIISAHSDQAVEAFQYGVLDFIPKPFDECRLKKAFDRYFDRFERKELNTRYLIIQKSGKNYIIHIDDIEYFKAANIYTDVHLKNGEIEISNKTMEHLGQILPSRFVRIHRSCIININDIVSYGHDAGGTYHIITKSGKSLPLSRKKYQVLQQMLK